MVTIIAVLGGTGVLPSSADSGNSESALERASSTTTPSESSTDPTETEPTDPPSTELDPPTEPSADPSAPDPSEEPDETAKPGKKGVDVPLPADSGSGKRAVFSEGQQRVWMVNGGEEVIRSYLVSGSVYDNLDPGTYEVYDRSETAYGIDDSGTMQWFVRFTKGDAGAAIGFHSIPTLNGSPLQDKGQLGTPLSHGCIRQKTTDAKAMWRFAPVGTTVVVTD